MADADVRMTGWSAWHTRKSGNAHSAARTFGHCCRHCDCHWRWRCGRHLRAGFRSFSPVGLGGGFGRYRADNSFAGEANSPGRLRSLLQNQLASGN